MSDNPGPGTAEGAASMHDGLLIVAVSKTFPGMRALQDVDLEVRPGEVHGLVGSNGSGKSTIIKILAGFHQPDPGWQAWFRGEPFRLGSGPDAHKAGIRFVHQDLGLVESESAIDNLAMGYGYRTSRYGRIKWREERARAREMVRALGHDIDVTRPVSSLSPIERTALAIARATRGWSAENALLVLDEPTAALPQSDIDRMFSLVERLRDAGASVVYVSHHLDEVLSLSDRVTVIRDGRKVETVAANQVQVSDLVSMMTGAAAEQQSVGAVRARSRPPTASTMIDVDQLAGGRVESVSFSVSSGGIIGFAGLAGSGRDDLAALIFGGRRPDRGAITVDGAPLPTGAPHLSVAAGIGFVPGDRHGEGLLLGMSIRENLTLPDLGQYWQQLVFRKNRERSDVQTWIQRLGVVTTGPDKEVDALSGGNQQKVVLARWLRLNPKVLLLDEPTQGVDVAAQAAIHVLIEQCAEAGAAVVVCSSDEKELVRLCDQIHVLVRGRITDTFERGAATAEDVAHAISGSMSSSWSEVNCAQG